LAHLKSKFHEEHEEGTKSTKFSGQKCFLRDLRAFFVLFVSRFLCFWPFAPETIEAWPMAEYPA
jgi:hypothetical protein